MRSSSSRSPPTGSRDATGMLLLAAASACSDEGGAVLAARRWVGWEEEVVLEEEDGRRIVYYYLRRAPPRGGGGRSVERELAIVGALRKPPINMQYVVHGVFLRSLEAAAADRTGAPPRLVAAAEEAAQLTWRSRKEVMDWLTSLVSDSPYGSSSMDGGFDEYPSGDHNGDVASIACSPATKDLPLALAGNNLEGFEWLGPVHRPDERRKHYKSFRLRGSTISVHDFVYIKRDDKDRHVAYVEDMYEDVNTGCIAMVRWFDKVDDDHGAVLPPDVNNREVFFSYGLQDLRVEWVEGLAAVLNIQHFEQFQNSAEHNNWQPYLCYQQIENGTLGPFDITQLQGYPNQEILRTLVNVSSSKKVCINTPTKNEPSTNGVHKRKRDATDDQAIKNHGRSDVVTDPAIEIHTPHNIINDQISITQAPHSVNDDQISKTHAPDNVTNDQTVENYAHSNAIINVEIVGNPPLHSPTNDQAIKNNGHNNVIIGKTVEVPPSSNLTNGQNPEKCPWHNATNDQATEKRQPLTVSGSGLPKIVSKPNIDQLFQPGRHVEVLSQDSTMRGCWFRCVIIKRKEDLIKVWYQDVQNDDKTGNVKEWLKLSRIANPDNMHVRISGRPRIRPQLPQKSKIASTVASGTIVDAWWHDGWWEGIVMEQKTVGLIRVYFPGENRAAEFRESDLRRSIEWMGDKWTPLMERKDIICRLLGKDQGNQVEPQESASALHGKPDLQKLSLQLNMVGDKSARPEGQNAGLQSSKGDEKSSKPMAPKPLLQSSQKAGGVSAKPEVLQKTSLQHGAPAKPAAQTTSLQYGAPAKSAVQTTSLQYGAPTKQVVHKLSLQPRMKGVDESAKPYPQKTILQPSLDDLKLHCSKKGPQEPARLPSGKLILRTSEKSPQAPARVPSGKLILRTSEKSPQVPARVPSGKLILRTREKSPQEPARVASGKLILQTGEKSPQESAASGKLILQTSEKYPQEPARVPSGKLILKTGEKCNGVPVGENIMPYRKRSIVDLTDDLKSGNLKWAERKARGYCGPMGPLENTSSQEDISEFASSSSGNIVPVNPVPDNEVCITNREAPVRTTSMPNLFIPKWKE